MGVFGGLEQDKYDRQYSDNYIFGRLRDYFTGQRRGVIIISVSGIVISFLQAVTPIVISAGIDALEYNRPNLELYLLVGVLFITTLMQYFGNWWRRRVTNRVIGNVVSKMRKDAFGAAVERDMAFYDDNKTGKLLSRITNDTEDFGQILIFSSDIVSQVVQAIILMVVLFYLNIPLTLLSLVFLLPLMGVTMIFRNMARKVTRQGSRAMAEVNNTIQETVSGISVAKNFRQEGMIYEEFAQVNQQSYRINLRRGMVLSTVFPALNALTGFAIGAIVYYGARSVVAGTISLSIWYLYIQSVDRFWFPVTNLSSFWSQFQQGISSLERVLALIDAENTVQQKDNQTVPRLKGKIEFKDLNFSYKTGQAVLKNFSLTINPSENIAFVGHTGAGKSSIAKLIMRLYEFQEGELLIDGQDIRQFELHDYRRQLGFVPQMPYLFSGTVMENIRYARPEATDAEIKEIANSIGNGEWLETLPDGLQSDVGERGSRLSIGQRQLISLLRVLVQKPAIFILDEATASVDSFTESQIQEALELILKQSTSILIAHRLSTVRSADRIIVLKEGAIIEQGNHKELLAQNGHYAELYNTYFRHQSLNYIENAKKLFEDVQAGKMTMVQRQD